MGKEETKLSAYLERQKSLGVQEVTKLEKDLSLKLPAIFSNKFIVSTAGLIRITFLETHLDIKPEESTGTYSIPRASIVLRHADAVQLFKLLGVVVGAENLKLKSENLLRAGSDNKNG